MKPYPPEGFGARPRKMTLPFSGHHRTCTRILSPAARGARAAAAGARRAAVGHSAGGAAEAGSLPCARAWHGEERGGDSGGAGWEGGESPLAADAVSAVTGRVPGAGRTRQRKAPGTGLARGRQAGAGLGPARSWPGTGRVRGGVGG